MDTVHSMTKQLKKQSNKYNRNFLKVLAQGIPSGSKMVSPVSSKPQRQSQPKRAKTPAHRTIAPAQKALTPKSNSQANGTPRFQTKAQQLPHLRLPKGNNKKVSALKQDTSLHLEVEKRDTTTSSEDDTEEQDLFDMKQALPQTNLGSVDQYFRRSSNAVNKLMLHYKENPKEMNWRSDYSISGSPSRATPIQGHSMAQVQVQDDTSSRQLQFNYTRFDPSTVTKDKWSKKIDVRQSGLQQLMIDPIIRRQKQFKQTFRHKLKIAEKGLLQRKESLFGKGFQEFCQPSDSTKPAHRHRTTQRINSRRPSSRPLSQSHIQNFS